MEEVVNNNKNKARRRSIMERSLAEMNSVCSRGKLLIQNQVMQVQALQILQ